MRDSLLLEITVETVAAAIAAERGGADRVELCSELRVGGLTPSPELMRAARAAVRLPMFAMIRPRRGDFIYSEAELTSMRRGIEGAQQLRMDGVVLGVLKKDGGVDVARTKELVEMARPLPVTFHRAFDETPDLSEALEHVIGTGMSRILSSGGANTAPEGLAVLSKLIAAAGERIIIVPGSGINPSNIARVARETGAHEFHSGLSSVLPYGSTAYEKFEGEVQKLKAALFKAHMPLT